MKRIRKLFFSIHSWIGIRLSILFFVVCFSGTLATLSHEMDWLFLPEMRVIPSDKLASRNLVVSNLEKEFPDARIQYWMTTEEPYLCDIVYVIDDDQLNYVFVNQYTGAVQGKARITFQRFFRDLHYYLFIPFQVGHYIVLVFGFMLFISMVTSLFFYKKWYRKLFELKTGKGPLVFFRSLHRLVGVWSVPITLIFSITGIWYFIERTNLGGVGNIANPSGPVIERELETQKDYSDFPYKIDYDRAVRVAQEVIPGLEVKDILPARNPSQALYLNGLDDTPLVRNRANRVYLDPLNYQVLDIQRAKELNTITWVNDIADPIHFGYWGGLLTKVIWFICGLGISSLILTGIWISQKRKIKSSLKMKAQKMGIWKYVNWMVFGIMMGYMYYNILGRYHAPLKATVIITAGLSCFIFLGWYLFDYRLKKVVDKEVYY